VTAARIAAGRTGLETCATPPLQPRRCQSAMCLMDIADDEAPASIRPVICHPHQPIIPRLTDYQDASSQSVPTGTYRDRFCESRL
jgi:hypothetical protein